MNTVFCEIYYDCLSFVDDDRNIETFLTAIKKCTVGVRAYNNVLSESSDSPAAHN